MAVVPLEGPVVRARGRGRLGGLDLPGGGRVACDTLVVALPGPPATELARQAGARLSLDPPSGHFRLAVGPDGAAGPGLFAAGELCGPCGAAEAADAGARAGEAARG
jgi:sarcosine oxidase subunit alpha